MRSLLTNHQLGSAFKIKDHLGSGNFGSVYKGEVHDPSVKNSKFPVAIKSMKGLSGSQEIENFLYEIKIMGYRRSFEVFLGI